MAGVGFFWNRDFCQSLPPKYWEGETTRTFPEFQGGTNAQDKRGSQGKLVLSCPLCVDSGFYYFYNILLI
jgi:hypothetical protein